MYKEGFDLVELDSGLQMLSRKPDILAFLARGLMPEETYQWRDNATYQATFELIKNGIIFAETLMISCCVDPVVIPGKTPEGQSNERHPGTPRIVGTDDISVDDKIAYFRWATDGFKISGIVVPQRPDVFG